MLNRVEISLLLIAAVLFATAGSVAAGPVTIPNTFQSGQPALASEVNGNFSAVANEINDNAASIAANALGLPMYVKHNGTVIGRLLDMDVHPGQNVMSIRFITIHGYVADITNYNQTIMAGDWRVESSPIPWLSYYIADDCSGESYTNTLIPGIVQCIDGVPDPTCYYIDKLAIPSQPPLYQEMAPCTMVDPLTVNGWFVPFTANDEAITGIPNDGVFTGPITISAQ